MKELGWSDALMMKLGKIMGKMHQLSQSYQPADHKTRRPDWDDKIFMNSYEDVSELSVVREKLDTTVRTINAIKKTRNTYGLIHGDIHFGNLKIDHDQIVLFDFDSCSYCWFINDIAILLFYSICNYCDSSNSSCFVNNFLHHFLKGYEMYNPFDPELIQYLPAFLKVREIDLFLTLYNLPIKDYYGYEMSFMNNRKQNIENDKPFIEIEFEL